MRAPSRWPARWPPLALRGESLFAELDLLASLTAEDLQRALEELMDEKYSATVVLQPTDGPAE